MLSEKIKNYLNSSKDNFIEFTPKYQEVLKNFGEDQNLSSSFIEFMSKYDSEIHGKEGFIINALDDEFEDDNSMTRYLIENYNLSNKYLSLFNLEVDDYLLYNKEDDSVKLIEARNMKELANDNYYDKKWNSFNDFLEDFFELNEKE